jgi:hypothetical protein
MTINSSFCAYTEEREPQKLYLVSFFFGDGCVWLDFFLVSAVYRGHLLTNRYTPQRYTPTTTAPVRACVCVCQVKQMM